MEDFVQCEHCKKYVLVNKESTLIYCPQCFKLVFKNIKNANHIKDKILGNLQEKDEIFKIKINKLSDNKHSSTGILYRKGFTIFISNVRIGEIVNIMITKIIKEKGVAFAKVKKYLKIVGERDFARNFGTEEHSNGISFGGQNRKKCSSVWYPEERKKNKTSLKKRKKG